MKGPHRSTRHFIACALLALACQRGGDATGSIAGTVRTDATPAPKVALPESVNKVCGESLDDPTLQLGKDGALANAVVWVEDAAPTGAKRPAPVLDQKRCAYSPPVLVAHTGTKLKVKNSDPLMHNVRAGQLFNVGMPIEGQVIERALPDVPGPVKLVCDVHPWMRADVMVLPHEQWAITDADGHFKLDGVQPGKRPLHVWHPLRGEKTVSVEVPAGGEGKADTTLP